MLPYGVGVPRCIRTQSHFDDYSQRFNNGPPEQERAHEEAVDALQRHNTLLGAVGGEARDKSPRHALRTDLTGIALHSLSQLLQGSFSHRWEAGDVEVRVGPERHILLNVLPVQCCC